MSMEFIPFLLFLVTFLVLLAGYPVAISLAGVAIIFAGFGISTGTFNPSDLGFIPGRLFGVVTNQTLIAVPLFVFMGVLLEKTKIAESLLTNLSDLLGHFRGGLAITVVLVGMLMAASTGIVGATVVTMGMMSLPIMLQRGYQPSLATGTIAATGTLGQIIPPSIALVLLGDVLSNAYQQAQLTMGIFAPKSVSVGDLFAGALIPGLVLVVLYLLYLMLRAVFSPSAMPERPKTATIALSSTLSALVPPLLLIVAVLGSIIAGYATPTEAAGVGAMGALVLAFAYGRLTIDNLRETCAASMSTTAMVFSIGLGIAVDDTIHYLARLREEARRGLSIEDIIENTTRGTGRAVVLTTVILVTGLSVNGFSEFIAMEQFGLLSAFTLVTALIGVLFLLPVLVQLFRVDKKLV